MIGILTAYVLLVLGAHVHKKYVHQGIIIMLALMFSSRNSQIFDTDIYMLIYENPEDFLENGWEWGSLMINYIFSVIFKLSFSSYLFVVTYILLQLWYVSTKRLFPCSHAGVLLLLFMSFFGFFYLGIALRNAFALFICYFGIISYLTKRRNRLGILILYICIATLFHKTSLVLLLITPILNKRFSSADYMRWFYFSLFLIPISSVSLVKSILDMFLAITSDYDKFYDYLKVEEPKLFTITYIYELLITLTAVHYRDYVEKIKRNVYDVFLKINLIGFSIYNLLWSTPGVTRLSGIFYFTSGILFYMICFHTSNLRIYRSRYALIFMVSFINFAVLISTNSFLLYY